jgi:hypothetical protein
MSVPSATTRGGGESRQGMNGHVFFWDTFVLTAEVQRSAEVLCIFLCSNYAILVVFFY